LGTTRERDMILTVGGIKGGSGKTSVATGVAVMLARLGRQVLLVDADEQQTSMDFSMMREAAGVEPMITTVALHDTAVRTEVRKMLDRYDDIVIDTGGRDTTSQRAALTISDFLLVPFVPGSFDVWTCEKVDKLVGECAAINEGLHAFSFLNRADHQGADNSESAEILSEMEHVTFWDDVRLGVRKAFRSAGGKGLAVCEWKGENRKGDSKAEEEFQVLFDRICGIAIIDRKEVA